MTERRRGSRRVLVVDDDAVARSIAAASLTALGLVVEQAEDGESAIARVERNSPDLVVLDVEMPGLDGFQTCTAIRGLPAGAEIPILIATGNTDQDTIDRAFQVGATDFIRKPLDWQLLQHRVRFMMRATSAFGELRDTLSRLMESESRLAQAQSLARVGHWEWVFDEQQMYASEELLRILEPPARNAPPTLESLLQATHREDRSLLEKALGKAANEAEGWSFDHRIVRASGAERIVHHQAEVVLGGDGAPDRIMGTVQDITERRAIEERVRYLAHYDVLTALPNRQLLQEHLGHLLVTDSGEETAAAILFLDIDRFKRVNDTLGHALGDQLLQCIADRLRQVVRTSDIAPTDSMIARVGGDEFTLVLSKVESFESAAQIARRLLDVFAQPFVIDGNELAMTASIGIALHPEDGEDADSLLRNADTALHHAKNHGRNAYEFYNQRMNDEVTRKLRIEGRLRRALDDGDFELDFQPQYRAADRALCGVEALVRLVDAEAVAPSEFIPLAEETGLIDRLGEWVLQRACSQMAEWRERGLDIVPMAINLSSVQVRKPNLVGLVARELREHDLDPSLLELEITESTLLTDDAVVRTNLNGLKKLGVRLALDDFGTGYSSLSHLVKCPIDVIKIDQSFVSRIRSDRDAAAIVSAVTALGHELGLTVCAEGVETEEQEEFLRNLSCDILQGFLFSEPLPAEAFAALLMTSRSAERQSSPRLGR